MEDVRWKIATIKEAIKRKALAMINKLIQRMDHPFTLEVMARPLLVKFKPPQMEMFDDTWHPLNHLEVYKTHMNLQATPDKIICWAFPNIIKGSTWVWFSRLKLESIPNFIELSQQFIRYFIGSQRHKNTATYLLNVKENKGESLWDYVSRFNKKMLQVDDAEEKVVVATLMVGLLPSKFLFSLLKNLPLHMADLMLKAQQHVNIKDIHSARRERESEANPQFDKRKKES